MSMISGHRCEVRLTNSTRIFANPANPRESPLLAEQLSTITTVRSAEVWREGPVFVREVIRVDPRRFARFAFNTANVFENAFATAFKSPASHAITEDLGNG